MMNDDVRRPRALVLSGHDLSAWRRDFARGSAPAALPYEADALTAAGFDLTVRSNSPSPLVTRLRAKVEHRTRYGVALPLQAAPAAWRSDVVIALLEREGALPAILRRRGVPPYSRRPLVIYSWRLAHDLRQASPDERRELVRRYSAADLITHMSPRESSILVESGFDPDQLFGVTFGVSDSFYVPGDDAERDLDLLAVGQDHGRDYATLFAALEGTDLRLDLVCRPENLEGLRVPPNVVVHGTVPIQEYRQLLRRAKVVAVPTEVRSYPTGSSVVLEAAASGCCVVATDTPAMRDYVTDGETGVLVPPGDVGGWRDLLGDLLGDEHRRQSLGAGGRRLVEERFNARYMWQEVADVIRDRRLV